MLFAYLSSRISNTLLNTRDYLRWTSNCCYFSCYLFRKLSKIIVENVSITLFIVLTVIADIFYPIFTLTITVLVFFIPKEKIKEIGGFAYHQGISLDHPSCNRFWLWEKPVHPYFFCIIPRCICKLMSLNS